jgi:hypothetical protein
VTESAVERVGLGVSEEIDTKCARTAKALLDEATTDATSSVVVRDNQERQVCGDFSVGEHLSEANDNPAV